MSENEIIQIPRCAKCGAQWNAETGKEPCAAGGQCEIIFVRRFDCPSCGGDSWLHTDTMTVTHSVPTCAAWDAKQTEAGAVGNVVRLPPPEVVNFACPECNAPARLLPRASPMEVQHAVPSCELWEKIQKKKDDVERYLIKAGVHVFVPER